MQDIPEEVFTQFKQKAEEIAKTPQEDSYRISIIVDSTGVHYNNPYVYGHEEFMTIRLWRDSLIGVIVYGKW